MLTEYIAVTLAFGVLGLSTLYHAQRWRMRWLRVPAFLLLSLAAIAAGHGIADQIGLHTGFGAMIAWHVFAGWWWRAPLSSFRKD